jgi:hypothetical protein
VCGEPDGERMDVSMDEREDARRDPQRKRALHGLEACGSPNG